MRITAKDLTVMVRGRPVLDRASMEIDNKGLTCLLGPNGAGKSTLMRVLSGEVGPSSGSLLIDGEESRSLGRKGLASTFAALPQGVQDPPYLTVRHLVAMGRFRPTRRLWWRPGLRDLKAVDTYLESCDVGALADRPVSQLSGGEKQRTWLAFCLAQEKRALLLDESLDALDFRARRSFFRVLAEVAAEGRMVVLATHDLGLAREFAGWVIVLDRGRVVYEGPPAQDLEGLLSNGVETGGPDPTTSGPERRGF